MLKTFTLLLTLCVSGGDTSSDCPYDSVTQCPTLNNKCCKCVDDDEVECKEWDDDDNEQLHNTGPISILPPFTGREGWPQTKFSINTDVETLPRERLPPGMQKFTCWCSKLTIVPDTFFIDSKQTMKEIEIYGSPMESISNFKALGMLTALRILDMEYSDWRLTGLTDVSFTSLPFANTLNTLRLRDNLLTSIPDTSLLTSLEDLQLGGNKISGELSHTFPQSLKSLYLNRNNITTISSLSFPEGKSLSFQMLDIDDNPITAVSSTAFDQTPKLIILRMDGHHLTRLPLALAKLTKLHSLDIKPAVNDEDETWIKDFQCTCGEASLTNWYAGLVEMHHEDIGVKFSGECKYGSANITVEDFLKEERPKCPKNEGGEQDGKGDRKGDGKGDGNGDGKGVGKGDGKGVGSAGYPIYSSPVLSFFCLVICLLVYVS